MYMYMYVTYNMYMYNYKAYHEDYIEECTHYKACSRSR